MSYELDMSQYLALFLQEAREQLEILEQETLKLEQDPTMERMQIIFRSAHTLKGSARAMGFQHLAELTHEMENLLDLLRNGALLVTTPIADALLACQDMLFQMVDSIENGQGDQVDCSLLVRQLQQLSSTEATTAASPVSEKAAAPTELHVEAPATLRSHLSHEQQEMLAMATQQSPVFHALFRLENDCAMKYVRAFMALSAIQEHGEILVCVPDAEQLEEEKFDHDFEFAFHFTEDIEALKAKLKSISEVEAFEVKVWQAGAEPASLEPVAKPELTLVENPVVSDSSAPATAAPSKKTETGQTVRVDVSRLDNLMNLVGELVIDRTRIAQIGDELSSKYDDPNFEALSETVGHIHRITSDLQDQIMKARMMPIESVFNRFPRVVRDLAQKLGKEVKLDISGGETELDRSVIEVIGDPLLHILRNSVDHGLESPEDRRKAGKPAQGTISLTARHQENHIVIEITDDGKGIDVERVKAKAVEKGHLTREQAERMSEKEALQLIFASGLSTAKEVSEVSGRGVGMDIVRSNIQKLGGLIDLETTVGTGTKFSLRLPLTLAIIRGLLVDIAETVYVLPLGSVVETLLIRPEEVMSVNRREVIVIRGLTTPLIRMNSELSGSRNPKDNDSIGQNFVVIVGLAEQRVGLVVDRLIGEREVVIKSLSRFCGDVPHISGATILGDGNVALILDVNSIVSNQRKS